MIIIIDDFLSNVDFKLVQNEIKSNHHLIKEPPAHQDTKQFLRWYVDRDYEGHRKDSDILRIMQRELFEGKFAREAKKHFEAPWIYLPVTTHHETQVTKYMKGNSYMWHNDNHKGRLFNYILYMNDDFKGGELALSYTSKKHIDKIVTPKTNRLVVIPSFYWHKVRTILDGNRYTVNGHIGMR